MINTKNHNSLSYINKVIQEINWPLLASITAHGLFFTMIFPQWHNQNNQDQSNNNSSTPIIELNALEQTRLPNSSPPNTFNWNRLEVLPPTDNSLSNLTIPLPPLPSINGEDYNFPVTQNSGGNLSALPPPPSFNEDFSFNSPQANYNYDLPTPRRMELPPPPPMSDDLGGDYMSPPRYSFSFDTDTNLENSITPEVNRQITTVIETEGEKPPVNQIISEEEQAEIRKKLFANSPIEVVVNPRDIINNRNTPTNLGNNSQGEANSNVNFNESLVSKLGKNSENTTDEEARKNYVEWAGKVQSVNAEKITLRGQYPKDACIGKLEGTTTYGVTVNSNGNVVSSQLIKSSGYGLFNNQALRQITSRQFPNNTGGNIPYHVYVNFNYDPSICPSLSINNLGDIPANTTPKPLNITPKDKTETTSPISPSSEVEEKGKTTETVIPTTPKGESSPNNEGEKPKAENSDSGEVKTPIRVDNLETPKNNADVLLKPNSPPAKPNIPTPSLTPKPSPSDNASEIQKSKENETPTVTPRQMINQSPNENKSASPEVPDSSKIKLTE